MGGALVLQSTKPGWCSSGPGESSEIFLVGWSMAGAKRHPGSRCSRRSTPFVESCPSLIRPCTRNKTPLTLSWERIPRLDSDVRITCGNTAAMDSVLIAATHNSISGSGQSILYVIMSPSLGAVAVVWTAIMNNRFFWVDEKVFPTVVAWRTGAPKDGMPPPDFDSALDVTTLNTCRTPIQKQSERLLCLVRLSRRYFLGDDVYPTFLYDDDRDMDLFNLISAPNPTKVKTGTRPCAAHEVPLLTATANRVIDMDTTGASGSSETPSTVEKSPLDFATKDLPLPNTEGVGTEEQIQDELSQEIPPVGHATTAKVIPETGLEEEVATMGPPVNKRRKQMHRKKANDKAEANAPPKVLRKDHVSSPAHSAYGGKSLAAMGLGAGSISSTPSAQGAPTAAKSVSDPDPLSYAKPQPSYVPHHVDADLPGERLRRSPPNMLLSRRSPGGIYQPGWGVTNDYRLDTPAVCQGILDHIAPPRYFSKLRHLPKADFLSQYNMNLVRQVAIGSQVRLRFEQEVRATETEVHGLRNQTNNLETLLEAEADMKKAAEAKNAELTKELESLHVWFSDLQVNNNQLSQEVYNLQAQITGEEKIKAAFEEFKKYEDVRVEQRCAEMDA
ncbi:hypothetical protein Tco_1082288 [Tanacetum coccineum]|uniref:Uncharacterized protein n=1 Tax=Tanacetum coccineum TaxID=301880 RepID=A0ABQ5I219_9ASTR